MERDDLPPGTPRMSTDASCLAALAHALRAPDLADGSQRLLRGLQAPLSIMGGLVVVRASGLAPIVSAVDLPEAWVETWKTASSAELNGLCAVGLVTESLGESSGRIHPDLKLSGVRSIWALPLVADGKPAGAIVLASREEGAFPPDMRLAVDAVAVAFSGWVSAHLSAISAASAASAASAVFTEPVAPTASAASVASAVSAASAASAALEAPETSPQLRPSEPNASAKSPASGTASASSSAWDILAIEPDLAVVRINSDRVIESWSPRAKKVLGWTSEDVIGNGVEMLFLDEDHLSLTRRLLRRDDACTGEWQVDLRSQKGHPASCAVRILDAGAADDSELGGGSILLFRDRRSEKGAEKWLRWSRALLSVLGVSTVVLDPGGRIRELGAGWLHSDSTEGVTDWLGRHFSELVESDRREVLACLRAAARDGEWTGRLTSGGLPVTVTLRAVRDDAGDLEALVGGRRAAVVDETRDLFRRIPLGIIQLDSDLRVVETNPELASICGASSLPDHPTGLDVRSLGIFQTGPAQSALDQLVASGELDLPDVHLRGDGRASLLVQMSGGRLMGSAGEVTGYLITVVSRTGKNDVERQLMRAQKMESIGNFASGLAHDFGNFVAVILGKAGVLRVKLPGDPHITGDLEDIETAAKRAQHLAAELMKFARGGRNRTESLSVNHLIGEVGALIRTSVGKRIQLSLNLSEDIPDIRGDEVELQQMVLNLCLNSRDAMPNGGRLVLETSSLTDEQRERLRTGDDVEEGICLSVKDTGVGMPPAVAERVFEPFYTTKDESQQGTGLGLAMVYGIVRRHGGTIDVHSTEGVGTTFEILLPAAPVGDETEAEAGRQVLVVDDEPAFREMIRLILEEDGFQVQLAANGIEALRTLRDHWEDLSLVILDLRMPGLDGLGVLGEIRTLTETLPVLVTTGYAGTDEKQEALRKGAQGVLEKPYRVKELRAALEAALASGGSGSAAQTGSQASQAENPTPAATSGEISAP